MFGATRFIVAGAIVALSGGILLSGALVQPGDELQPPAAAAAASSPEHSGTWIPQAAGAVRSRPSRRSGRMPFGP